MEQRDSNFSILNKPPIPRTRSGESPFASASPSRVLPSSSLTKPKGVDWGRVTGVTQDLESMQHAYKEGGAGYMIGDALNRGARSFGSSAGQLFNQGVMPPVRKTAGFFGGLGRGVMGMEPEGQPTGGGQSRRIKPDGTTQAAMLAEQNEGLSLPDEVLSLGNPYGMTGNLYANATPSKGYGNVIYSDSEEGARGFSGGPLVRPHGIGPFGRSMATQRKIMGRVQAYNDATETYKAMRGASDTQRRQRDLESQAGASVSLNQGVGSFLNQAANRNYARKRLDTMAEQDNADREFAMDFARLNKPDFKTVDVPYGEVDPASGKQQTRPLLVNPQTGQMFDPLAALDSTRRVAPVEAVADLKEMLAAAKTETDRQQLLKQFSEVFDLPEGLEGWLEELSNEE